MSDALLGKACNRIAVDVTRCLNTGEPTTTTFARIAETVGTALVLARREAYAESMRCGARPGTMAADPEFRERHAADLYPLPTRTRQVLREEPVPDGSQDCLPFAIRDGRLMRREGGEWEPHAPDPDDFALMAHALDLHANPYRTEQVPGDESDPWGEGAAIRSRADAEGMAAVALGDLSGVRRAAVLARCTAAECDRYCSKDNAALIGWRDFDVVGWRCPDHQPDPF